MRLKYNFVCQEVSGSFIAVAVGDDAAQYSRLLRMNQTGKDILELLKKDITEDEIVHTLSEKYETEESKIRISVSRFIKTLMDAGVLDC